MPETLKDQSQELLTTLLRSVFQEDNSEEITFDELLEKIGYVKTPRENNLDIADARLTRLLSNSANTSLL